MTNWEQTDNKFNTIFELEDDNGNKVQDDNGKTILVKGEPKEGETVWEDVSI